VEIQLKLVKGIALAASMVGTLCASTVLADREPVPWGPVYGGGYSLEELMVMRTEELLALDPESTIEFKFNVNVVVDGVQKVKDMRGLPTRGEMIDGKITPESNISSASMTIPISTSDYIKNGELDSVLMLTEVEKMLIRLREPEALSSDELGSRVNSPSNAPNCGGYGLGSTYSETWSSCVFGQITSHYECRPNATGGKDWFLTGQDFAPPDVACIDP
jgi:hypothetical protein